MSRQYTVTESVGRPSKYSEQDFKDIINKTQLDVDFAEKFDVSVGTIAGIRTNQSKKLNIPTKDKNKNQTYGGKKMPYDNNKYHKKYNEMNKDEINARRRELYKTNKKHVLKQKAGYRAKIKLQTMEGTKMPQNNGESVDLIDHEINIDDYVKVTLSIPKKLTAMELKGIMIKANQLLKMSEVSLVQGPKRTYAPRRANIEWKDKLVQELVDNMSTRDSDTSKVKIMRAFGEKHDITEKDVAKRYYYLMGHGLLPKTSK